MLVGPLGGTRTGDAGTKPGLRPNSGRNDSRFHAIDLIKANGLDATNIAVFAWYLSDKRNLANPLFDPRRAVLVQYYAPLNTFSAAGF